MNWNEKYTKEFYTNDSEVDDSKLVDHQRGHPNYGAIKRYADVISGSIVDLGSDHGAFTILAAENPNVVSATAVDLFPESMKRFGRLKQYTTPEVGNKLAMVCCNVMELDQHFTEDQFDAVLTFHMLEHLFKEDLPMALGQMRRVLKAGGHLVISIPWEQCHDPKDGSHQTYWNDRTLAALFENNGFETAECFRWDKSHLTGLFKNRKG
jgi:ubiquinone/menaquinone biosynthesis C-methylase UbiE